MACILSILVIEIHTVKSVSLDYCFDFSSETGYVLIRKIGESHAIMVRQHCQTDFHTLVLQRFDVFVPVVEDMLHIGVERKVDASSLAVELDVGGEDVHNVEKRLAAAGHHPFPCIERVEAVDLDIGYGNYACFLGRGRHVTEQLDNEIFHGIPVLHCHIFSRGRELHREQVCTLIHSPGIYGQAEFV